MIREVPVAGGRSRGLRGVETHEVSVQCARAPIALTLGQVRLVHFGPRERGKELDERVNDVKSAVVRSGDQKTDQATGTPPNVHTSPRVNATSRGSIDSSLELTRLRANEEAHNLRVSSEPWTKAMIVGDGRVSLGDSGIAGVCGLDGDCRIGKLSRLIVFHGTQLVHESFVAAPLGCTSLCGKL